ncbi:hypothetical protein B0G76_8591 [Paraburkholderia sp. BL23I1N1]|nr:hypothetical protein B0G76_8591 [Paraburkholderia sp. BL23I1N1]
MINRVKVNFAVVAVVVYASAFVVGGVEGSRHSGPHVSPSWDMGDSDTYEGRYVKGNEVCTFRNEVIGDGAIAIDTHCVVKG